MNKQHLVLGLQQVLNECFRVTLPVNFSDPVTGSSSFSYNMSQFLSSGMFLPRLFKRVTPYHLSLFRLLRKHTSHHRFFLFEHSTHFESSCLGVRVFLCFLHLSSHTQNLTRSVGTLRHPSGVGIPKATWETRS